MTVISLTTDRQKEFAEAKPSRIVEMALEDLEAVEQRSDAYRIDMSQWHDGDYSGTGKCAVCFAGAVMAQRLDVPEMVHIGDPAHKFPAPIANRLAALNAFRRGDLYGGLGYALGWEKVPDRFFPYTARWMRVTAYGDDPAQFKRDMRDLVERLHKEGF